MPAWPRQAPVSWACRWPLGHPSECLQIKDTDYGPWTLPAATFSFSLSYCPPTAGLFCSPIPHSFHSLSTSPKSSDTPRQDPAVPFLYSQHSPCFWRTLLHRHTWTRSSRYVIWVVSSGSLPSLRYIRKNQSLGNIIGTVLIAIQEHQSSLCSLTTVRVSCLPSHLELTGQTLWSLKVYFIYKLCVIGRCSVHL